MFDYINYNDEVIILGYNGNPTEVIIPSEIEGKPVTWIGACTFKNCNSLTSVIISSGVTGIGIKAFYGCTNLKSVTIPESVKSIENGAFDGCNSLEDIRYTGAEELLKQIKIKKEGKEMSKLIEQMNGLNDFEVILGAYHPWGKGENKILARTVVKSFQEALPCLKACINFYDNFYTIFKERENISIWFALVVNHKVVLDSHFNREGLEELIEPNADRKTTIPQVSICRESVVSLYIKFNSCTLHTKWDFDWYQAEDAEYRVQELALNLMDKLSHSAIEFEGEIRIQEFEYNTPIDETYSIFVNKNGMFSLNRG